MDLRETLLAFHCCWRVCFSYYAITIIFISARADSNQYFLHLDDCLVALGEDSRIC